MNLDNEVKKLGWEHYKPWMAPFRMFAGIMVIIKGLYYIQHSDYIIKWFNYDFFSKDVFGGIAIFIAILYIFLGCLILIGLGTRLSCIILIPTIVFSIFFSDAHMNNLVQLTLSAIVLFISLFFALKGSGRFSVYYYFKHNEITEPDKLTKSRDEV